GELVGDLEQRGALARGHRVPGSPAGPAARDRRGIARARRRLTARARVRAGLRRLRLPWISVAILTVLVACAAFAPFLAPYDPTSIDMRDSKTAPFIDAPHLLRTDLLGRDMLSRLIYGARTSMLISFVALGAGALLGTVLGLISGHVGRWVDALIMRTADAALGFPTILVAMVIVVLTGAGTASVILAVALTGWARFARMIRGDAISIKEQDFVTAARIVGCTTGRIIVRHIFPSTVNTLLVVASLQVGQVVLLEASLSFLGLGLPPGAPSWGIMVSEGRAVILETWWLSLLPGLAITAVVL